MKVSPIESRVRTKVEDFGTLHSPLAFPRKMRYTVLVKGASTWKSEFGCMIRKCGACAMRINGLPRLACSVFLRDCKGSVVTLEPLSKFPLVKDLVVDRSVIFEALKRTKLWLEGDAFQTSYTHSQRYRSAKCLLCGCCLEVCPNFDPNSEFAGAVLPVNAYRILNEEQDIAHQTELANAYRQLYFEGCGKSLACQDICPAGIPVEELMSRSNAAAVWKR